MTLHEEGLEGYTRSRPKRAQQEEAMTQDRGGARFLVVSDFGHFDF